MSSHTAPHGIAADYVTIRSRSGLVGGLTGLVWVEGTDTVEFLDGLVSQNVAAMEPGSVAPSLLLAPNGKLRASLWLLRGVGRVGLVCDTHVVGSVVTDLSRFKIRVDVTIAEEVRPVWKIWGPEAPVLGPAAGLEWSDDGKTLRATLPFRHTTLPRVVVVGERPPVASVGIDAVEAVRIEVGSPIMGVDLTERTIPQEMGNIAAAVDFTKGCYLGQELVARIDSRGHVNRRLMGFIFEGTTVPTPGEEVLRDGAPVGLASSTAWSGALQISIGLGMLRIETQPGDRITVGGVVGRAAALPIHA